MKKKPKFYERFAEVVLIFQDPCPLCDIAKSKLKSRLDAGLVKLVQVDIEAPENENWYGNKTFKSA